MSRRIIPVMMVWQEAEVIDPDTGETERRHVMVPLKRFDRIAHRQFSEGESYPLAPVEPRSRASHSHYFAALNDAFNNLPEGHQFPTVEHLRKWVLVETGWCTQSEYVMGSLEAATALMNDMRGLDAYCRIAHVEVPDEQNPQFIWHHVVIRRAVSQAVSVMAKEPFEASKKDVLDYVASMIGTTRRELTRNSGRAA